jgi:hypothetical protein
MTPIDLRTYNFIDSLQLQMASFLCTVSKGYFPVGGQSCAIVEIAPGIEINRLTDIALKATNVVPGIQVVERSFGLLEVHSDSQGDTRQAGQAILKELDLREEDRIRPRILTSQLIKNISDHHAQLINKIRFGNMVLRGNTVFILEIEPAGYAYFAANDEEIASNINIVNFTCIGKYGRIYIAGEESAVLVGKDTVEAKLAGISGREPKGE